MDAMDTEITQLAHLPLDQVGVDPERDISMRYIIELNS